MSGFVRWRTSCYKIYGEGYSWSTGKQICTDLGGDLITITDDDENKFAIDFMTQQGNFCEYYLLHVTKALLTTEL